MSNSSEIERRSQMGRVDMLFDFLKELGICSPQDLNQALEDFDFDTDGPAPLVEQIVDYLLSSDNNRSAQWGKIEAKANNIIKDDSQSQDDFVTFMHTWSKIENLLTTLTSRRVSRTKNIIDLIKSNNNNHKETIDNTIDLLKEKDQLVSINDFERRLLALRIYRNKLVHHMTEELLERCDERLDEATYICSILVEINSSLEDDVISQAKT